MALQTPREIVAGVLLLLVLLAGAYFVLQPYLPARKRHLTPAQASALQVSLQHWCTRHKPALMYGAAHALRSPNPANDGILSASHALALRLSRPEEYEGANDDVFRIDGASVESLEELKKVIPQMRKMQGLGGVTKEGKPVFVLLLKCGEVLNVVPIAVVGDMPRVERNEKWLEDMRRLVGQEPEDE